MVLGKGRIFGTIIAFAVVARTAVVRAQTIEGCGAAEVERELERELEQRTRNRELADLHLRALSVRCPTPRVRGQVGFEEWDARRWSAAYPLLRDALASTTDPWVTAQRARLERALHDVEQHLPRVSPQTNIPGAELRVNGEMIGRLPLATPWVLVGGSGLIELSAPGYRPLRRTLSLAEGEVFRELMTLTPETSTPTTVEAPRVVVRAASSASASPRPARASAVGPWIVAGSGVALVAAGGVFWALRGSAIGACAVEADAIACPTATDASQAQGAAGLGLAANVSLGVGIAATAGGVLWWLLGRSRERPASAARVIVVPLASGAGLSVGGVF